MLIEGDNYHALTCLNYSHKGKIGLIYIDPPYNTGSDGFVYKDKGFWINSLTEHCAHRPSRDIVIGFPLCLKDSS